MKKSTWLARLLGGGLLLTVLLSLWATPAVALPQDLSRPGESAVEMDMPALLQALGYYDSLQTIEKQFLEDNPQVVLTYSERIPSSCITVTHQYSSEGSTLAVVARPYAYTGTGGSTVTWLPLTVSMPGTEEVPLVAVGEAYEAVVPVALVDEGTAVSVRYGATLLLDKSMVGDVLNATYDAAVQAQTLIAQKQEEYEKLCREHDAATAAHEAYLSAYAAYLSEKAAYEAYLGAKTAYEAYRELLEAWENYDAELAAYEQYLVDKAAYDEAVNTYALYQANLARYETEKAAYDAYQSELKVIVARLKALDIVKVKMTNLRRNLYDAIMGDSVTQVLANMEQIKDAMGAEAALYVEMAQQSTVTLRLHLENYFSMTTVEEKYSYYCYKSGANTTYYSEMRDAFKSLLISLDYLYHIPAVRRSVEQHGKGMQFVILLSQLDMVVGALETGKVKRVCPTAEGTAFENHKGTWVESPYFGADYRIHHWSLSEENTVSFSPRDVLGGIEGVDRGGQYYVRPADLKPNPLRYPPYQYPAVVECPTPPAFMEAPTPPVEVSEPTCPPPLGEPVAEPTPVIKPTAPPEVPPPGERPIPYEPTAQMQTLVSALEEGSLTEREGPDTDLPLSVYTTVSKGVDGVVQQVVITFHPDDTHSYTYTVDRGTPAVYDGIWPKKQEDAGHTYHFDGWCLADGQVVSVDAVEEDMELYPHFSAERKQYTVLWDVNGVLTMGQWLYGSLPTPPQNTDKPADDSYAYRFLGFSPAVAAVEGNARYTAVYEALPLVRVGDSAAVVTEQEGALCVQTESDGPLDLSVLLTEKPLKNRDLILQTNRFSLTIPYILQQKMVENRAFTVSLSMQEQGSGYSLLLSIGDGAQSLTDSVAVSVALGAPLTAAHKLFTVAEGARSYVFYTAKDGQCKATLFCGTEYTLAEEYRVSTFSVPGVTITADKTVAVVGERVELSITPAPGKWVERYYVTDGAGQSVAVENSSFLMPSGSVTVGAVVRDVSFTVTFLSEGNVLRTLHCKWGDTPEPPADPKRVSDGKFSYTFCGWSPVVAPVYGDAVFSAQFEKTPLPQTPAVTDGPFGLSKVSFAIVLVFAVLVVFGVAYGTFRAISIIRRIKYR